MGVTKKLRTGLAVLKESGEHC